MIKSRPDRKAVHREDTEGVGTVIVNFVKRAPGQKRIDPLRRIVFSRSGRIDRGSI
jgi:hypothetical protein